MRFACVAWIALGPLANGQSALEFWTGKNADAAAIDAAWREVPAALRPAVEFEKLLHKVRGTSRREEWQVAMAEFASAANDGNAVRAVLAELAKCWLARAQMEEIDSILRGYYRKHVRFPSALDEVMADIPEQARRDPWGEAWVYEPAAPAGFARQKGQRYRLGPTRYPQLSPLEEAVRPDATPARDWKVAVRDLGGVRALEFRSSDGRSAVIQPGGRFGEIGLVYLADRWALLADTERLFAITPQL